MGKDKELLVKVFGEEIEQKLEQEDFDVNEFTEQYTQSQKERFKQVFENDENFKSRIYGQKKARDYGTIDQRLKKFGLEADELKEMSLTEKFDALSKKIDNDIKTASKEGVEELQEKLIKSNKEKERLVEEVIPQLEQKNQKEIQEFYVQNAFARDLANTPKGYFREDLPTETINETIEYNLRKNYDLKLEDGQLAVYVKGKDTKPLKDKDKGVLTYEDAKDLIAERKGLKKKNNAGQQGGGQPPKPEGGGGGLKELKLTGVNQL